MEPNFAQLAERIRRGEVSIDDAPPEGVVLHDSSSECGHCGGDDCSEFEDDEDA